MVKRLGALRKAEKIAQYHTRNGNIYARIAKDRKYTVLDPWLKDSEVLKCCEDAKFLPPRSAQTDPLARSQSLRNLPVGHVAGRREDLIDYVVGTRRQARNRAK